MKFSILILIGLPLLLICCHLEAQERHLKAAYAKTISNMDNITAFYREIEVLEVPKGSYSAITFNGGYVGLAGPKRPHINFSVWDQKVKGKVIGQSRLVKSSEHGSPRNHRFGHEGSGVHAELDFKWQAKTRYKIFIRVEHSINSTFYSAYFGKANEEYWHFIATIEKPGIHFLRAPGGFLEHVGKKLANKRRATAFYGAWVSNGKQWQPVDSIRYAYKAQTSNAVFANNGVIVQIGLGLTPQYKSKHLFSVVPIPRPNFPVNIISGQTKNITEQ